MNIKNIIKLFIIGLLLGVLGGYIFPPKTVINSETRQTPKDNICEDIEEYTNKKAVDL